MNKKFFNYLVLLLALFVGALYYSNTLQSPLISALNSIKLSYHTALNYVEDSFNKYFFQAQKISDLTQELKKCKKEQIIMHQVRLNLQELYRENNSTLSTNPNIELIRTISYEKFGDFNHLWVDVPDYNSSKIYGLLYGDIVAGIVVAKNSKPLALLNNDIKSSYSVFIGEEMAPGIAHGDNKNHLIVNFIPSWFHIKTGDKVVTSGLDNIFFKDLKVGKVISITTSQGYQNAVVAPYFTANEPNYFYIIRKVQ